MKVKSSILNWTHFTYFCIQDSGMYMIILFISRSNFILTGTVSSSTSVKKAKSFLFWAPSFVGGPKPKCPQGLVGNESDISGLVGTRHPGRKPHPVWGQTCPLVSAHHDHLWMLAQDDQIFRILRETRNVGFMWNFLRFRCWQLIQIFFKNIVQAK